MRTSETIDKLLKLTPPEDYSFLRREGIKNIEKLAGDVWTDYNTHDPGITLLENLCYAITDLAYRTGFDMKDLLARKGSDVNNWKNIFYTAREILPCNPVTITDFRKLVIDIDGVRNAWITISKDCEVPVFLKKPDDVIFKEIKAQQEAEGEKTESKVEKEKPKAETKEEMKAGEKEEQKRDRPITEPKEQQEREQDDSCCDHIHLPYEYNGITYGLNFTNDKIIELNGLYKIIVEYEEEIIEKKKENEVRKQVLKVLHRHRNICEDYLSVTGAEYKDFFLQSKVQIKENADADMILAEMCYQIQNYFTPVIRFYSLDEMELSGMPVDEIFEGPALKHGFIPDKELEKTDMFRDMRLSDIINFISDIEGINTLQNFKIAEAIDETLPASEEHDPCSNEDFFASWTDNIKKEKLVGRLSIEDMLKFFHPSEEDLITPISKIYFYKPSGEVIINTDRFQKLLNDLKGKDKYMKMKGFKNNYPVPTGENMELDNFYPVQYQLPFTYRVGKEGLPLREGKERLIQSLQLKGYLAIFEQLFLNYLYLLDNLNEIFSFNDLKFRGRSEHKPFKSACEPEKEKEEGKEDSTKEEKEEYHPPLLNQIIYKNEEGQLIEKIAGYKCLYYNAEKYLNALQATIQPESDFEWERNMMLDHLLSRFNEQMNEYVSLMKYMYPDDYIIRVIKNKADLLADYPAISNYRMRAYNYKLEEEEIDYEDASWDEEKIAVNISGLEKRIARHIGLNTYRRRDLAPDNLFIEEKLAADGTRLVKVVLYEDRSREKDKILLETKFVEAKCGDELMHAFIDSGCSAKNFKLYPEDQAPHRRTHKQQHTEFSFVLKTKEGKELAFSRVYHSAERRKKAFNLAKCFLEKICGNEGFHMIEHILLRPKGDTQFDDEGGKPYGAEFKLLDICLDECDLLVDQDSTVTVDYRFDLHVLPPEKCLDGKRWKVVLNRLQAAGNTDKDTLPVKILEHTFKDFDLASDFISSLREYGSELVNFVIYKTKTGGNYYFKIKDKNGKTLVESSCFKKFSDSSGKDVNDMAIPGKRTDCDNLITGRGIIDEIAKLKEFLSDELDLYCCEERCNHNHDPYSFRVTFVLPCWPQRFRNKGFRNFVEKIIRSETPAHIKPNIFWLGITDMRNYEDAYFNWLIEIAANDVPDIDISNNLIDRVINLKDCDDYCDDKESIYSGKTDYEKQTG